MVGKLSEDAPTGKHEDSLERRDEELLATLGYKQEFKREFTPLEVSVKLRMESYFLIISGVRYRIFNYRFTAVHFICFILRYTKWRRTSDGLGRKSIRFVPCLMLIFTIRKWAVASFFILCVGMSMAELASAAPTSGGVRA